MSLVKAGLIRAFSIATSCAFATVSFLGSEGRPMTFPSRHALVPMHLLITKSQDLVKTELMAPRAY
jgi:hypothetical protein